MCSKPQKVAVQNRKRRVLSNPGRGKRRRSSSSTSSEPKRVTPQQRTKEFPGEQLVVSSYKQFLMLMSSLSLIRHQFFEHNCKNNNISREKRKHNYNILQAFLKRVMLRKSGIIYPTLAIPLLGLLLMNFLDTDTNCTTCQISGMSREKRSTAFPPETGAMWHEMFKAPWLLLPHSWALRRHEFPPANLHS